MTGARLEAGFNYYNAIVFVFELGLETLRILLGGHPYARI